MNCSENAVFVVEWNRRVCLSISVFLFVLFFIFNSNRPVEKSWIIANDPPPCPPPRCTEKPPPGIRGSITRSSSWTYRGQILSIFHAMGGRDTNPTISTSWPAWGPLSLTRASAPTSGPPARLRPRPRRTASPASGTTFCWSRWRGTTFSGPPTCTAGTSWCVRWVPPPPL